MGAILARSGTISGRVVVIRNRVSPTDESNLGKSQELLTTVAADFLSSLRHEGQTNQADLD